MTMDDDLGTLTHAVERSAYAQKVQTVDETARKMTVRSPQSWTAAAEFVRDVLKPLRKEMVAYHKDVKAAAKLVHAKACEREHADLDPIDAAIAYLNGQMSQWSIREETKRVEKERTASAAAGDAPVTLPSRQPQVKGVAAAAHFTFEIVDEEKLPRAMLIPDEKRIGDIVRRNGKKAEELIPGIRVVEDKTMSYRSPT